MKHFIKKILLLILASSLMASVVLCPISAAEADEEKPKTLLALGDSLTTGYGLENYQYGGDPYLCNSYINMIARALGLEGGKTYINRAVNGDRSADLARLLPGLESEIKAADLIIITIGGNDLLSTLPAIASKLSGQNVTDSADAIRIIAATPADAYAALAADPAFTEQFAAIIAGLESNLKTITSFIREKAPHARVVFLKQYNPLGGIPDFAAADEFASRLLGSINSTLEAVCTTYGFEVVDAPSVIDHNALELTNIRQLDIHPNEKGHTEIAKLLAKHLGISLGLPGEETQAPAETTAAPEAVTEPTEETTAAPEAVTEPTEETTAPPEAVTNAPEIGMETSPDITDTAHAPDGGAPETPTGCGAFVSPAAALAFPLAAAFVMIKKKH